MQKEKNYGWALDSARKNPYNSCVAHPGVAQLVARMVRVHEAVGSTPATRTKMNDPTQFEQVNETCEFGGVVVYSESLDITAFF